MEDKIYLVTKYASGGDLLNYCIEYNCGKMLEEKRIRHIFAQIAKGVRDIHSLGIFHRDLKLQNIFISRAEKLPQVQIGDLGLSVRLRPGESVIKQAGTKPFMAPEMLLNQPCDFQADIWSLGILLYTLICSGLPFPSEYYDKANEKELKKQKISFSDSAFSQTS